MSLLPRILLLDESADDRELVSLVLRGAFGEVDVDVVEDAAALARAVSAGRFGAVLTEASLPWIEARDLLRLIRDLRPQCPVLVITGRPIAEVATELLHLAPDGLIPKTSTGWVNLPRALRSALYASRRRAAVEPGPRRLLDALPAGVFVASREGTVIDANPAFARLLGFASPEDCAYRSLRDLLGSESEAEDLLARLSSERTEELEVRLRRVDGGTTRAFLQAWRVEAEKGGEDHVQGLLSERPRGGAAVVSGSRSASAESPSEAEEMAYTVSHDLRQPLTQVIRLLEMLQQEASGDLGDEAGALLDSARGSAARLDGMIEAVLRCARIESATAAFTEVDLDAVLTRVLERLEPERAASGARIERDALPAVHGDEHQLEQLLSNLLENALKFRSDETPLIVVEAREERRHWHFAVRDNGIGIAPADAQRVFQLFQRLHTEKEVPGSGIGLAVCRRVVARHGGRIWVEPNSTGSGEGGGSTFHFTLAKRQEPSGEERER